MNGAPDHAAIEALLDFYVEAGLDCALDEEPHDRFAESAAESAARRTLARMDARPAPAPSAPSQVPSRAASGVPSGTPEGQAAIPSRAPSPSPLQPGFAATAGTDELALLARARAREAQTLEDLKQALAAFDGCALKLTAKSLVFADGNPAGRVMLVGEAPGADEDRMGLPFVGRSGQLLDKMLAAIGLDRTQVYIANLVPWRPPGNRTPTPQEAAICRPFIERQIELADPDVLVCLGAPSAQALLGTREGILRTRGRWFDYETGSRRIRALATLHPAYLLRQPLQKRLAWRDLCSLRKILEQI